MSVEFAPVLSEADERYTVVKRWSVQIYLSKKGPPSVMEPISYGESFRAVNQHDQCDGSRHSSVPIVACFALAHPKYAEVCPTCDRKTVEAWESTSSGAAAPSEIIDLAELESEGEGAAEVAALTGNEARADAVPAVDSVVVVAADVVGGIVQVRANDDGRGSIGKGQGACRGTQSAERLVGGKAVGRAAEQGSGAAQGARVAQWMGRGERAAASGRRQTETRERATGG